MSSNIRIERICQHCTTEFIAKTTVTKYCSDNCAKRAYKVRIRQEKIERSYQETIIIKNTILSELNQKEFLTVKDASLLLNCSIRTMYRLIAEGTVKAKKLSQRKTLIKRSELDKIFA